MTWVQANDVAIGGGILGQMIAHARARKQGTDIRNIRILHADATCALSIAPFDKVMAFSLLHLVPDISTVLRSAQDQLKRGGLLISKTVCLRERNLGIRMMLHVMKALRIASNAKFLVIPVLQKKSILPKPTPPSYSYIVPIGSMNTKLRTADCTAFWRRKVIDKIAVRTFGLSELTTATFISRMLLNDSTSAPLLVWFLITHINPRKRSILTPSAAACCQNSAVQHTDDDCGLCY